MYGYKCFNKGLTNRYGMQFEVGKLYHSLGDISFGNDGNGFHMCKNLEDTLRYFDAMESDVDICLVECFGKHCERTDEYNGFFQMYSFEYLKIIKVLSRDEIINYELKLDESRVTRFVSLFKLNDEEIVMFKEKFQNCNRVIDHIDYYQNNNKNIFVRRLSKDEGLM